jgi:GST-like protein
VIEFYSYTSPNARKVLMALEETGIPYEIRWVDILAGDQHSPEYREINPNGKVPAIIDTDAPGGSLRLFESGAILQYLAERSGKLLPADLRARTEALCWVHWQMSGQGPALGQAAHFVSHAPNHGTQVTYAIERFQREARRIYQVLDDRLAGREWIVDEFSIADIACFPWTRVAKGQGIAIEDFPAVQEWSRRIAQRPSAKLKLEALAGLSVPKSGQYTHEQFKRLFERPSGPADAQATSAPETEPEPESDEAEALACSLIPPAAGAGRS